ncbi:MAG: GHKL domain-containing protein [Granulosicoccus sp.]|nr:GHKL domain-containing protein [Granulosicoccus sp.]
MIVSIFWSVSTWTRQVAFHSLETQAKDALQVYSGGLASEVGKFRELPQILSRHQSFKDLLAAPEDTAMLAKVNGELAEFNVISNTLATYILNNQGRVIASSNWHRPDSFIGEDLSFRPYFKDAIRFGYDAYFAIGTTAGKRGYYFSSAINLDDKKAGVVVVKVDLAALENNWRDGNDEVVVTDSDGVIFLSTREDWLYRGLYPMDDNARKRIHESRRYANVSIEPLDITHREELSFSRQIIALKSPSSDSDRKLLQLTQLMPSEGWSVHVLFNMCIVEARVLLARIIVGLFLLLCAAGYKLLQNLIQAREQKARLEKEAYDNLELLVQQRTQELTTEIRERKQTEQKLQKAQNTLVQTAKMAALGHMATSITHELSQPLGAIRNFADNAQTMLKRDQVANVDSNLKLISRMTERMNDIMQHLKSFARKTPLALEPVSIHHVLRETLLVLGSEIKRADVKVNYLRADDGLLVVAESNRLQQVFTNLLQNAIDSMKNSDPRIITLSTIRNKRDNTVSVTVTDTGTGIDETTQDKLFEPFFSTKSAGDGLGLGLSISYGIMRDLGGDISVTSSPGGGACFKLILKEAEHREITAA